MRLDSREQSESHTTSVPEQALRLRTGQSFLERLGVIYADQIRLTIVTELYMREMSPKQFFEGVGGTSYDSVRRHFMKLVDYGWLRRVRTEAVGRGRPEVLYRSTELPVIDDETWGELPVSIRDACTVQLLEEMGERLGGALKTEAFASRKDRLICFTPRRLDSIGWSQAIQTLNNCFRAFSQEQTDAKVRLERSNETPTLMIVELGGFELSGQTDSKSLPHLPLATPILGVPAWPHRLGKVCADPLNLAIVEALNHSAMSPTQLHESLGGASVEAFDRKCKGLVKLGWITKVQERSGGHRRGATENFYRATLPAASQAELFNNVPHRVKVTADWGVFQDFCQSSLDAVRAGTFNRRPDRHLSLCTLLVDELGWQQVIGLLWNCSRSLVRIGEAAKHRMGTREPDRPATVGCFVAGFAGNLSAART